jgi:hypothetical protein
VDHLFNKFNTGEILALFSGIGFFIIVALFIVCMAWYYYHKLQVEAALKQDMLDRGLSADQIQQVLQAAPEPTPSKLEDLHGKNQLAAYQMEFEAKLKRTALEASMKRAELETKLKEEMIKRGMSAEDIERVLAARLSDSAIREQIDLSPSPTTTNYKA